MAMSAEYRLKFASLHRQWWRLHMSEKFQTINPKQTNKQNKQTNKTNKTNKNLMSSDIIIIKFMKHSHYVQFTHISRGKFVIVVLHERYT